MLTVATLLSVLTAAPSPEAASAQEAPLPSALGSASAPTKYPAPRDLAPVNLGAHITRTMSLLAQSTPTKRNRVKVLVYGQSISKQAWSLSVEADLRARFPNAELLFENRSIGGFISKKLLRTMPHDVIPFYPDLVIFHVYGGRTEYEAIIREIRTRTTAEILVSNDHITVNAGKEDHVERSWQWLPALASRWDLELADARRAWVDYMDDQKLKPADLVAPDGTHLNDRGNFVLAEVIKRHLVHDPKRPADPHGMVKTVSIARELQWKKGRLFLPFDGNRIDVLPLRTADPGDGFVTVRIDDTPPSRVAALYALSRPNANPNRDWPWEVGAIIHVDHQAPLRIEEWTVQLAEVDNGATAAAFTVWGSLSGFDGQGRSDRPFISHSGQVVLSPDDWFLHEPATAFKVRIARGFKITWRVLPQSVDTWMAPTWIAPNTEAAQSLMQGLAPGPHRLLLSAEGGKPPPIAALRVYRPPYP